MKSTNRFSNIILNTVNDNRVIIIRLAVGLVFLTEGIQKFLFPELLGTGRFEKIGFSNPEFWADFTAVFEILCSSLLLLGLVVRLASIPLLIIMPESIDFAKVYDQFVLGDSVTTGVSLAVDAFAASILTIGLPSHHEPAPRQACH